MANEMATINFVSTLSLWLLFLAILASECSARRFEKDEDMKQCKKESRKALKQIVKDFGICNTAMKNKTKSQAEHSSKIGCVVRCVLDVQKMLDKNGMVTNQTIEKSLENRVTLARPFILQMLVDCKKKFGDALDPKDDKCEMYGQFGQCVQVSIADVCEAPIPV